MQKLLVVTGSFIGVLFILLFSVQSPLDARAAADGTRLEQHPGFDTAITVQQQPTSCATLDDTETQRCQQLEAAILDVTLRLEITVKTLDDDPGRPTSVSVGHATVADGRFLITHNHFAQSPDKRQVGQLLALSAYRADGSLAIHQAPAHTFQVFAAGPETLVFDFGQYGGQGAFDYMGMDSAQLATWQALGLRPGSEVAQVNWDGEKTRVNWVQVLSIDFENGTPTLQVDNYVEPGASGGGVFYAGFHIGNTWFRDIDKQFITGKILRKWSVAALNETSLVDLAMAAAEPPLTEASQLPNGNTLLNLATAGAVVR